MIVKEFNFSNYFQIKLERVLGVTVPTNAALANDSHETVAYPAG